MEAVLYILSIAIFGVLIFLSQLAAHFLITKVDRLAIVQAGINPVYFNRFQREIVWEILNRNAFRSTLAIAIGASSLVAWVAYRVFDLPGFICIMGAVTLAPVFCGMTWRLAYTHFNRLCIQGVDFRMANKIVCTDCGWIGSEVQLQKGVRTGETPRTCPQCGHHEGLFSLFSKKALFTGYSADR